LIAFLDSDDRWLPRKLELQLGVLGSDPSLGFVTAMARVVFEADAPHPRWMAALEQRGLLPEAISTLVVRRETFEEVGGFDPALPRTEDFDWRLRALEAGVRHRQLSEPLIEYRVHGGNMSHNRDAQLDQTLDALRRSLRRRRDGSLSRGSSDVDPDVV
jgi:hypothetical protein